MDTPLPSIDTLRRLLETPPAFGGDQVDEQAAPRFPWLKAAPTPTPTPPATARDAAAAAAADDDETAAPTSAPHVRPVAAVGAESLGFDRFVRDFMLPNRPVLIRGAATGWRAEGCLARGGRPDAAALARAFGERAAARVTDCASADGCCREEATLGVFAEWWRRVEGGEEGEEGAEGEEAGGGGGEGAGGGGGDAEPQPPPRLPYLKDFHLVAAARAAEGEGGHAPLALYSTPLYFRDDWLNGWHDSQQQRRQREQGEGKGEGEGGAGDDGNAPPSSPFSSSASVATSDYRFLYAGVQGTWTPVHADVLRSYSWSANVCGRKRWWLLPPAATGEALLLRPPRPSSSSPSPSPDDDGGAAAAAEHALPPHFFLAARPEAAASAAGREFFARAKALLQRKGDNGDADDANATATSNLRRAVLAARPIFVDQGPGDALFVPAGWHHVVENHAPGGTLSINHNWINAFSAHWSLRLLLATRRAAARQLEEGRCRETARANQGREFEALVQRLVKADAGMDFQGFAAMVGWAARRARERLAALGRRSGGGGLSDGLLPASVAAAAGASGSFSFSSSGGSREERARLAALFDLQRAAALLEAVALASRRADEENWAWLRRDGGGDEQQSPPDPEPWALEAEALAMEARGLMKEHGAVPLEPALLPVYGEPPPAA